MGSSSKKYKDKESRKRRHEDDNEAPREKKHKHKRHHHHKEKKRDRSWDMNMKKDPLDIIIMKKEAVTDMKDTLVKVWLFDHCNVILTPKFIICSQIQM